MPEAKRPAVRSAADDYCGCCTGVANAATVIEPLVVVVVVVDHERIFDRPYQFVFFSTKSSFVERVVWTEISVLWPMFEDSMFFQETRRADATTAQQHGITSANKQTNR